MEILVTHKTAELDNFPAIFSAITITAPQFQFQFVSDIMTLVWMKGKGKCIWKIPQNYPFKLYDTSIRFNVQSSCGLENR